MIFRRDILVTLSKSGFDDLTTKSFEFKIRGERHQGFVVKKDGKYYAYLNLCQHLPVTLDLRDNSFFTHDKSALQCQMHGAIYTIETGDCTGGPCQGTKLKSFPIEEQESRIVIRIPIKEFS